MAKIEDIKDSVEEAFEELENLDCDLLGLYNYIRYANEDFGNDKIVNESKPISDNTKVQHYYLVFFILYALKYDKDVPKEFVQLYKEHKDRYQDESIQKETNYLEEKLMNM